MAAPVADASEETFQNNLRDKFRSWLMNDREGNEEMRKISANMKDSMEVDLADLERVLGDSRQKILDEPHRYMPVLEDELSRVKSDDDPAFGKDVKAPRPRIALKGTFGHHHVTPRGLTSELLTKLVCIDGIVTRCGPVTPKMVCGVYYCEGGDNVVVTEYPDKMGYKTPLQNVRGAPRQNQDGHPFTLEVGLSVYRDTQRITIQEMPERAPTGLLPRAVEVLLEGQLVNTAKPGQRVRISAYYKPFVKLDGGVTSGAVKSFLIANRLQPLNEDVEMEYDPADLRNIRRIIERPDTLDLCGRSFAPSICGHELVKKGLILQLLGGLEKDLAGGTHLRGDCHVLLIGDPSCGKSQLLRFVLNTAPLAVSTTGRGSSGVGLTASVVWSKATGDRHLEAGAMVLADRGVVCIDEFDKMSTNDRTAIHEVMEQQTVTIAKAGMHVQLNARCSVVAAANPIYGTFDDSMSIEKNIHLPDSLLSRFDLIFLVRDLTEPQEDRRIARQVLRQLRYRGTRAAESGRANSEVVEPEAPSRLAEDPTEVFIRANLYEGKEVMTVDFLKKLLKYCKDKAKPDLSSAAVQSLAEFYRDLRQKWKEDLSSNRANLPVTTRLLESAIRLATAHAKLKLRPEVLIEDVEVAKELILLSRGQQLEAEIQPEAAVGDAEPAAAAPGSREADFIAALALVLTEHASVRVQDLGDLVNAKRVPSAQAFSPEEVRECLEKAAARDKCVEIEGVVMMMS